MAPGSLERTPPVTVVGSARWRLFLHDTVASTNDLAKELSPWSAVRARAQTLGRGRFGRRFVSDPGGLWLSAAMPAEGDSARWAGFSLMVGCHLLRLLEHLAVPKVRLRWPNDLMSGRKKLAGLLIEQGTRDSLTVGIGMNVHNAPWRVDASLTNTSTRLADLLPRVPDLDALSVLVLDALHDAQRAMLQGGLANAIDEINRHWNMERPVEVTLTAGEIIAGLFLGLNPDAHLRILLDGGRERLIAHHYVAQLTEVGQE